MGSTAGGLTVGTEFLDPRVLSQALMRALKSTLFRSRRPGNRPLRCLSCHPSANLMAPGAATCCGEIGALAWIQDNPEYSAIADQLPIIAMNLQNLRQFLVRTPR